MATFIGRSPCHLVAHLTDTVLVDKETIAAYRLDQAASLRSNLDWYRQASTKARGAPVPEIEDWYMRHIKRAGLASQVSHGEFVQAQYLIELVIAAVQKALFVYFQNEWRDDFDDFFFILDAKLPSKMAAGEKYLSDSIVPALGFETQQRACPCQHVERRAAPPVRRKVRPRLRGGEQDRSSLERYRPLYGPSRPHRPSPPKVCPSAKARGSSAPMAR